MQPNTASDQHSVIDTFVHMEGQILDLIAKTDDEAIVGSMAAVLRDLASVRMQIEMPGSSGKRASARIRERGVICVSWLDGRKSDAGLHDISAGGALIETDDPILVGESCILQIPMLEQSVRAVARSSRHGLTHLAFDGLPVPELIALVKHLERHFTRY